MVEVMRQDVYQLRSTTRLFNTYDYPPKHLGFHRVLRKETDKCQVGDDYRIPGVVCLLCAFAHT